MSTAIAQGPVPACTKKITRYNEGIPGSPGNCSTWRECPIGAICNSVGGNLQSCGPAVQMESYCLCHNNGTYNPDTVQCERNIYTTDCGYDQESHGTFTFYPSPVPFGGGGGGT